MSKNKARQLVTVSLLLWFLPSCSTSGPVHFYEGTPRPADETAHVIVPAPITVLKIDGKKADVPSKDDGVYNIYLLPGVHRIDFKYELYWGSAVSGYIVKSDIVGIETRFAAGKIYEMKYREPIDQQEAEELAADFSARLVERETGRVVMSRSPEELNRRGVQTALVNEPLATEPSNALPSPPADIDANTAANEDAVKRLKFWWLMANESERRRFVEWMKSVEPKDSSVAPAKDTSQ